jgi:phage major head subunit gpT-like protein
MAVINAGTLFQAGLKKVLFQGWQEEINELSTLFNMNSTTKAYEEWVGVAGIPQAPEKVRGADMIVKDIIVETPKRIPMSTFAIATRGIFEDIEDDQYAIIMKAMKAVGRSHRVAEEISRANIFNTGFLTSNQWRTGYDGKELFSSAHTLDAQNTAFATTGTVTALPARSATTWSNYAAADLSSLTFLDAVTTLRRTPSREGDFINIKPQYMLVPPELEPLAWEILKSNYGSGTWTATTDGSGHVQGNRQNAASRYGMQIISSAYLLDNDAWFMCGDTTDLQFFRRMGLRTKTRDSEGNWDTVVESMSRHGVGFHDPRGTYGSKGA